MGYEGPEKDAIHSTLKRARELSQADIRLKYETVAARLLALLIGKGIITSADQGVIREGWPNTDFGLAQPTWLTGALVANTEATFINNALNNSRYAAFWGVQVEDANPCISAVYFRTGAGATTYSQVLTEMLFEELEPVGYLTGPVVYEPNETIFVRVFPRAAKAGGERLKFMTLIAERRGQQVS